VVVPPPVFPCPFLTPHHRMDVDALFSFSHDTGLVLVARRTTLDGGMLPMGIVEVASLSILSGFVSVVLFFVQAVRLHAFVLSFCCIDF